MTQFRQRCCAAIAFALLIFPIGCASTQHAPTTAPRTTLAADPMPVFKDGTRILFQGDSITDGNRGRNGDPNHILGHGYQALIASRFSADLYDRHLLFMNKGISGNRVLSLANRWQTDTIDLKPDVLSILIGVNDLGSRVTAEQYEQQYDKLLSDTLTALPNVKLVLGEPFGLPVGGKKANWESYSADLAIFRAIVDKLGAKYHAPVVHYQAMFEEAAKRATGEYWIWDGVHPTYAGHQLMADEWIKTVRAAWPASK